MRKNIGLDIQFILIVVKDRFLSAVRFAQETDDWVNVNSAPRRARIGLEVILQ